MASKKTYLAVTCIFFFFSYLSLTNNFIVLNFSVGEGAGFWDGKGVICQAGEIESESVVEIINF